MISANFVRWHIHPSLVESVNQRSRTDGFLRLDDPAICGSVPKCYRYNLFGEGRPLESVKYCGEEEVDQPEGMYCEEVWRANRKRKFQYGPFVGKLQGSRQTVDLSEKEVRDSFGDIYVDSLKEHCRSKRFVPVFVGAPRDDSLPWKDSWGDMGRFPLNEFPQGKQPTCLYSSFACYLSSIGMSTTAQSIVDCGLANLGRCNTIRIFVSAVTKYLPKWKIRRLPDDFDILRDRSSSPTVALLVGDDGSCNHAITVCHGLLFDSNLERAYPLQKGVVDWCVSSWEIPCEFLHCSVAYRLERPGSRNKRRKKLRSKKRKKKKVSFKPY